jgi:hypothetical protein
MEWDEPVWIHESNNCRHLLRLFASLIWSSTWSWKQTDAMQTHNKKTLTPFTIMHLPKLHTSPAFNVFVPGENTLVYNRFINPVSG